MWFCRALRRVAPNGSRTYATQIGDKKVAVLGAAGGIGQPLSLLLKSHPGASSFLSHLSLYDVVNTPGVAADLSHINTSVKCTHHTGSDALPAALDGADVVVIPAGVPRKPGMSRQDLFNTNASIVQQLTAGIASTCPQAQVLVISNPVNSTVPIAAETLKKAGVYDRRRLFGVTTLDLVRASCFVAEAAGKRPENVHVDVLGGHSGKTILPVLSRVPGVQLTKEQVEKLTNRIQFGGDEVVKAKDGLGSATLSMAYAGARFTLNLLRALKGESGITEAAFVESDIFKKDGVDYFSTQITLGRQGVESVGEVGPLDEYEQGLLKDALEDLKINIKAGVDFAK
uniref:Malate dehydrogenase n=1 Tax=Gracilariopsis lemaneiformis TaxID=2782 RepID=A0A097IUP7_GRALE|nr:malate dehydrogenase [Gracilariopsis lemaneiformis]